MRAGDRAQAVEARNWASEPLRKNLAAKGDMSTGAWSVSGFGLMVGGSCFELHLRQMEQARIRGERQAISPFRRTTPRILPWDDRFGKRNRPCPSWLCSIVVRANANTSGDAGEAGVLVVISQ